MLKNLRLKEDSSQIQPEDVSLENTINNLCEQDCFIKDENKIIGSIFTILTSKKIMKDFLKNKITERELFFESRKNKKFECIYICSEFILPEYRGKGIASQCQVFLLKKILEKYLIKPILFQWSFSDEGSILIKKLACKFGLEYFEKKH